MSEPPPPSAPFWKLATTLWLASLAGALLVLPYVLTLQQAALAAAKLGTSDQKKSGRLWAGLSVNHPIFIAGQTKDLRIEFTLVNDGDSVIDPKIEDSRIVINGKERTDSGLIFSSVENGSRFRALSPGESLQFDCLLGDQFREPGTYRISWKGAGFESPEIMLRVLPEEAR